MQSQRQGQTPQLPAPKKYRKPQVVIYGNIKDVTQSAAMMGMVDGGTGKMTKSMT